MKDPRLTRRRFMAITGAGAASAGLAGAWRVQDARAADGDTASYRGDPGAGRQLADAVITAFEQHRVVAIGEMHSHQEHHDALQIMLADPRLPEAVDDIVVEFGNSLYQPVMDRFTVGPAMENHELRQVWRNTTQSPLQTWDQPIYEHFYRTVRAANWPLPADKQIRVLLGDPPIDWSTVTTQQQLAPFGAERDSYPASLVEQEVLAKGRRALICYGGVHVAHSYKGKGSGAVALIEEHTGERAYVIAAAGHPRLSSYPRRSVIACKGTWLEAADSGQFDYLPAYTCGVPLGLLTDAVLYLGQLADQTQTPWNPAIYLDPVYWAELQRRNAIKGNTVDLAQLRQELPVAWPLPTAPNCPPASPAPTSA
jgi:hypothetical protein